MILEEFLLKGKVAIVTGAGRGIGKSIAMALAEAGAHLVVASRSPNEIEVAAEEIRAMGRQAIAVSTDVTDPDEVEGMVERALEEFGKIDILVNNAGKGLEKPLMETSLDEWHDILETNLTSMFLCCQAVGRHMLSRQRGKVINMASGLGELGMPNSTAYCASKGGVIQLTRALALEWAPRNVHVNAIGPCWFSSSEGGQTLESLSEDLLLRYIPAKRRGTPEDLEGLVVYFASDSSSFITGQIIYVDGGIMSHP
ncbi:MAG: glucose 1-dehydrogenase [Candidatus Tectomicrobia bacterium]|nr:glucose 1-dehydrogenase [Candidatus Tectomicrobia bacterium]